MRVVATVPTIVSYEEWLTMPEVQDAVEEVVNGEIRIMPPNKLPHPLVVMKLQGALVQKLDSKTVYVFASVFGLVIRKEPLTCRVPDIAVFRKETIVEQDGYIHSAPQLVIEVLSPSESRRDQQEKLRDYESIGTPEAWLVSPQGQTIEVFLLEAGRLRS
ncbi:MAG: Uma2 family endonuclease, partial [Acidobacteria bacterium]|nr:Uma2 family endonuclease [Acidobacteriota bacterium]